MSDHTNLTPDLEALHRELEALEIDERPSFGPELKAELESELLRPQGHSRSRRSSRRLATAATIGGLLALSSVPGVRASLVRAFDAAFDAGASLESAQTPVPTIRPQIRMASSSSEPVERERVFIPIEDAETQSEGQASWVNQPLEDIVPEFAYPVLQDPGDAERIVQMFYPRRLQEEGVGGEVRVMVWVDEHGATADREVLDSSNVPALDRAALSALGRLRFRPARRGGAPVGSWVKFTIKFEPAPRIGAFERGSIRESESVLVDPTRSASARAN